MAKDFKLIAKSILENVGGLNNIKTLVHCATRLRFILVDESIANDDAVKSISGVITIAKFGGQYQVVIGNDVTEVYDELAKLGVSVQGAVEADSVSKDDLLKPELKNYGNMLISTISGVFTPILAALMGIGLIKGVIAILTTIFPAWATSGDMSYVILYAAGDTLMYFLPVLVAYTASQKFGLDPIVGMIIGASLLYPDIVAHYPFGPWGINKFLGLDILVMMRYSGTVLPSIFAVYGASKLYKSLRKHLPSSIKNFLAPFFTIFLIVPLTFLLIGPVFGIVGLGIQNLVMGISNVNYIGPIMLGVLLSFSWQILVIFGLHWAIVPIMIAEAAVVNPIWGLPVTVIYAALLMSPITQVGAVFAMALKMKNRDIRSNAIAAGIGGIFGITEPIIYGFTLPKKMPFLISCIVAGIMSGIAEFLGNFISNGHGIASQMGAMGIFAYPSFLLPGFANSTLNFVIALGCSILAVAITFGIVLATYKPDNIELKNK